MDNRLLDLKKEYDEIDIPAELKSTVETGIERGKTQMKKNRITNKFAKAIAGIAAAFLVLTMAVNVSPVLAGAMEEIPMLGRLVKVLQFNNGESSGGELTDASDISGIEAFENAGYESIVINFSQDGINQESMGSYKITYNENPYTMTFEIGGARRISAVEDFEKILQNKNVKDVYEIITLDDSLIRFVIVFNNPVEYKVEEMESPASLVVSVREDNEYVEKKTYSLRTDSHPYGETIGIIEEKLMSYNAGRVLKDKDGLFFVEVECFDTKEAAEQKLAELSTDVKLFVEERTGSETPKSYPAQQETGESNELTTEQPKNEQTLYAVSIITDNNQYYGNVEILVDGINIIDEYNQVKHLAYQNIELTKYNGESSFILEIITPDNKINVSGVFSDFFEELEKYTEVK